MSFETIQIHFQLPVINGSVQLPDNLEQNKDAYPLDEFLQNNPTATEANLSGHSGKQQGANYGAQSFILMPGVAPDEKYNSPNT